MVKPSPFTFRDTIQYIFPVLLGAALFSPYFAAVERLEFIFLAAALFSYVLYTPLNGLARLVYRTVPGLRTPVRKLQAKQKWSAQHWDYDRLFYQKLDEKEREYLYLTAGYADFHRTSSFFLLCFTLAQVGEVIGAVTRNSGPRGTVRQAWIVRTEMVGGWDIPASIAILAGAILFWTSFNDYLSEADDLANTYTRFAQKYQEADPGLAQGMWGWVRMQDALVSGATVRFISPGGTLLCECRTDAEGRFQLTVPDAGSAIGYLQAEYGGHEGVTAIANQTLPQYTIELK